MIRKLWTGDRFQIASHGMCYWFEQGTSEMLVLLPLSHPSQVRT